MIARAIIYEDFPSFLFFSPPQLLFFLPSSKTTPPGVWHLYSLSHEIVDAEEKKKGREKKRLL